MIRKRIAGRDDRGIMDIIRNELLPHSKRNMSEVALNRDLLSKRLSRGATFVLLGQGMRLNGFVNCLIHEKMLNIDMIAVKRKAQGKGQGSELMKLAERYGRKQGCDYAVLYVDQSNRLAQQFYLGKGYAYRDHIDAIQCFSMDKRL